MGKAIGGLRNCVCVGAGGAGWDGKFGVVVLWFGEGGTTVWRCGVAVSEAACCKVEKLRMVRRK